MDRVTDVTITDRPDEGRFVIVADGTPAGEITYTERKGSRVILHTGIEEAFEGRGVGGRAVAALLAEMRARGERIVPLCPFVHNYIDRHPDDDDLVDHALLAFYEQRSVD